MSFWQLGGVRPIGDRPFGVISEGERQQVLLARALMSEPELLLLDEPFAGLDLGARERLLVRLTAVAADPGSPPIVLVTHHCEEIPPGFTHGGLMAGGELIASGPLTEVVTSERVSACFGLDVSCGLHGRSLVESRRLIGRGRTVNRPPKLALDSPLHRGVQPKR